MSRQYVRTELDEHFGEPTKQMILASLNSDSQHEFIEAMRKARIANGISLEEAARRIGCSPEMLESSEHGGRDLTFHEVRLMAIAAEVRFEFTVVPE